MQKLKSEIARNNASNKYENLKDNPLEELVDILIKNRGLAN